MLAMVKELKWHHLVVVHGSDVYSTHLAHLVMQLAAANSEICILSMEQYIYMEKVNDGVDEIKNSNQNIVKSVLSGNSCGTPILVMMQKSSIQNFLKSVNEYINLNNMSSIQLFFSNLLTHKDISLMPEQVAKLYSLSIQTDQLHNFEEYWQDRIRHMKVNENLFLVDDIFCFYFSAIPLILKYCRHSSIGIITLSDCYFCILPYKKCSFPYHYFSPKNP
jgi:hypothetical protein